MSVSWRPNQYAGTTNRVDLSTLVFPIEAPPDPLLDGQARAEAGSFTVTGVLAGIDLASAGVVFPFATGSVDSGFVRSATGVAGTTRSELLLASGTPAGCLVEGSAARCSGAKIERRADNDTGTPFPDRDPVAGVDDLPVSAGSGSVAAGGDRLGLHFGSGGAESLATGRSCCRARRPAPTTTTACPTSGRRRRARRAPPCRFGPVP